MISIIEAIQSILMEGFSPAIKNIDLADARNYILAEDVAADRDYPPFNRAAVDGFAVSIGDLESGQKKFTIQSEIYAGQEYDLQIGKGQCVKIMTGAAVPAGLDVLFKVEDCSILANTVDIPDGKYFPGMNISSRAENAEKGSIILEKGLRINERTVHSLAAVGLKSVPVFFLPTVSIISTGDEIVPVESIPRANQIRDSNYFGILYSLQKFNISPRDYTLVKDNKEQLRAAIQFGLQSDLLIISGGVSMGDADFVPGILSELGVKNIFHNVNIKPGKPLWFGQWVRPQAGQWVRPQAGQWVRPALKCAVFALPGNPLSTLVSFKIFIEPWLYRAIQAPEPEKMYLPILQDRVLKGNRPEYFPAKIKRNSETGLSCVEPLKFYGSGDITAAAGSDGLVFHPAEVKNLKKGETVEFIPWGVL